MRRCSSSRLPCPDLTGITSSLHRRKRWLPDQVWIRECRILRGLLGRAFAACNQPSCRPAATPRRGSIRCLGTAPRRRPPPLLARPRPTFRPAAKLELALDGAAKILRRRAAMKESKPRRAGSPRGRHRTPCRIAAQPIQMGSHKGHEGHEEAAWTLPPRPFPLQRRSGTSPEGALALVAARPLRALCRTKKAASPPLQGPAKLRIGHARSDSQ